MLGGGQGLQGFPGAVEVEIAAYMAMGQLFIHKPYPLALVAGQALPHPPPRPVAGLPGAPAPHPYGFLLGRRSSTCPSGMSLAFR